MRDVKGQDGVSQYVPFRLKPRPWGRLRERATAKALSPNEAKRVGPFVAATMAAAALVLWILATVAAPVTSGAIGLAGTLVLLGLGAEFLSFNQSKDQAGSAAAIPFAAATLVAPTAITVLLILAAEVIAQALHRRAPLKAAFNIAQHALGQSLGVLALYWVGGGSFVLMKGASFVECMREQMVPSLVLIAVVRLVNTASVS
ncbi:MAG TPA: hypothetical protein VF981_04335, partial [Gemmatimonadaceae bacterium]